jgi:hypothetical protein
MTELPAPLTIKSWAEEDRPREKLMQKGKAALSEAELLAILIGSGTVSMSAVELCKQILASVDNNLHELAKLNLTDLQKFKGIGEAKAITIMAALELGRRRKEAEIQKRTTIISSNDVLDEMVPYIQQTYQVKKEAASTAFMGFSLGGLSAFDISWHHSYIFGKVGVFSGSFWWRKKAYEDGYDDYNDRIMQVLVRQGTYKKGLKMWFEVGTKDETDDRNNNGIIDAIDDTVDLITELEAKGYKKETDIDYLCIENGEHNHQTWSECLPKFLVWAFGK